MTTPAAQPEDEDEVREPPARPIFWQPVIVPNQVGLRAKVRLRVRARARLRLRDRPQPVAHRSVTGWTGTPGRKAPGRNPLSSRLETVPSGKTTSGGLTGERSDK